MDLRGSRASRTGGRVLSAPVLCLRASALLCGWSPPVSWPSSRVFRPCRGVEVVVVPAAAAAAADVVHPPRGGKHGGLVSTACRAHLADRVSTELTRLTGLPAGSNG